MARADVIDIAGETFGNLLALTHEGSSKRGYAIWRCRCVCGKEVLVPSLWLRRGHKKSCNIDGHRYTGSDQSARDTLRSTHMVEYATWKHLRQRCLNPKDKVYRYYGGRGIKFHEGWAVFAKFLADMGPRPPDKTSIDRIDNNGDYEPGNCRWATAKEQSNNQRTTVFVESDGVKFTLSEYAERVGVARPLIYQRLKDGWTLDEAVTTPIRPKAKNKDRAKVDWGDFAD